MIGLYLESHKLNSIAACESFVKLYSDKVKFKVPGSRFQVFDKSELHFQTWDLELET